MNTTISKRILQVAKVLSKVGSVYNVEYPHTIVYTDAFQFPGVYRDIQEAVRDGARSLGLLTESDDPSIDGNITFKSEEDINELFDTLKQNEAASKDLALALGLRSPYKKMTASSHKNPTIVKWGNGKAVKFTTSGGEWYWMGDGFKHSMKFIHDEEPVVVTSDIDAVSEIKKSIDYIYKWKPGWDEYIRK